MLVIMCCVLPVKYADNIYQLLPTGGTIPNEPWVLPEETPTNRYQDPCSRCETGWWFWYGPGDITNAYQSADLGRDLPRGCFTNHYHRDGGQGIDRSVAGIVCQVAGYTAWHSVENRKSYQT